MTAQPSDAPRVLMIACGALARELMAINTMNALDNVTIECLPASLHNRPSEIPELVRQRIHRARRTGVVVDTASGASDDELVDGDNTFGDSGERFDEIFVGYADCGTGGKLADVCREEGVEMLAGAHCYQFFATAPGFERLQDHELGSFYLTDFLARNFERLVWQGLGIADHPELRDMYFGNYTRLVYLQQADDPKALACAHDAADRLGLTLHIEPTGYGELETTVVEFTRRAALR
ncbi:MAG: DUF1638 domain-containing protein [Ilumatobacter sp.]|nr:DUF1638 domain-containing protein [Ilumatobacter sp.]